MIQAAAYLVMAIADAGMIECFLEVNDTVILILHVFLKHHHTITTTGMFNSASPGLSLSGSSDKIPSALL